MKENLKSGLVNLQGLEFIYEKSLFPDLEYIFRHALVQEVAYNSLLINRRKEIHEKIGRAIEQLYPERLEEFCEMLAYHYSNSGNLSKAYEYLKQAAGKAYRKDALFESIRLYKEAMEVLLRLPPTDENRKEQIALVLSMRLPIVRIGYTEDYLPWLQKAEALAEELEDDRSRLAIRSGLGSYYLIKEGNSKLGWEYLESCSEHPELIQDIEFLVSNGFDLCAYSLMLGDYQRVDRIAPTINGLIENSQTQAEFYEKPFNPYSQILAMWGFATGFLGHFDKGERLLEKALSFAEEINHRATLGSVQCLYGILLAFKGDGLSTIKMIKKAIKNYEASQTMFFVGQAWTWLGYGHWLTGDYGTALELAEKGLKIQTDLGLPLSRSVSHWFYGLAHYSLGNLEEAGVQAGEALKCSLANNETHHQGTSWRLKGMVLAKADPGQFETAAEHIRRANTIHEELGMLPWSGCGYFSLGEVYAESGRKEEALENLKKAEALFEQMGMDYWLGKTREVLVNL
jgi:tetratricopeptide (TPR) repeat protein